MSSATHAFLAKDAWQSPRNAHTLRAYMALRNQEVASRIRELRKLRGNPPQERVAEALGVGDRTYQTWESGEAKPSYRNLEKLAAFYGVTEGFILEGLEDATPRMNGVPTQIDGGFEEFRGHVTALGERLGRIEQALEQAHIENTEHLRRQAEILERIEILVATLPSDETTRRLLDELRGRGAA